ncbi:hypothetical protein DPMN_123308 [Dreissena polymorpha]|uniref:Uncharacterized protein n=1 Tax=Dreissena polymorpha TaxID=45954 RepID=A0A9D4GQM3_DREPO|nr:hypothetical protein DPMN_123308 [Dreissena polymorpha]
MTSMVSTPLADTDLPPFLSTANPDEASCLHLQPALTNGLLLHRAAVPGLRQRPFGSF